MGDRIGACRVLVGKPEGKRPLGRPQRRRENKMDLQETELGTWTGLIWLRTGASGGLLWRRLLKFQSHKKKVKVTLVQALRLCTGRTAHRGSRDIALTFLDHGTRRGGWSASRPGRSLPPGKIRYPLYRNLGGPQGRCGQLRKISSPTGFDPRTVQPVAQSLYRLSYPAHPTPLNKGNSLTIWDFSRTLLHVSSFNYTVDSTDGTASIDTKITERPLWYHCYHFVQNCVIQRLGSDGAQYCYHERHRQHAVIW